MAEIQHMMGLSYSTLHTYLPYTKVIYKMSEISQNAERVKAYKARKSAVDTLMAAPTEEHLWDCIVAFQNYPFYTVSGLPFSYTLKKGRNGEYTKELFIDRRENSKSLAWSSIKIVFNRAIEKQDVAFTRPKELADVRGVSYTFSLLWRFGMISVAENLEKKLRGSFVNLLLDNFFILLYFFAIPFRMARRDIVLPEICQTMFLFNLLY